MTKDTTLPTSGDSVRHAKGITGGYKPPRKVHSPGSKVCECSECGEWFTTDNNFLKHQLLTDDWVKCLTPAEMRKKGMTRNVNGVWQSQANFGK